MPANLGGDMILVAASCDTCQQEINRNVETVCLGWWQHLRYIRRIGSRRIKQRSKTLKLLARVHPRWRRIVPVRHLHDPIGDWEIREVPYAQHPAFVRIAAFKAPGILRHLTPEQSANDYLAGWCWNHMEQFQMNPSFHSVRVRSTFHPIIFARMIAKVAHCVAVQRFGVDGFEPFLTEIIRGIDLSKTWYFIGGDDVRPVVPIASHLLARLFIGEPKTEGDYIFAEIRLFANLGAPIYYAIVGQNPKRGIGLQPYRGLRGK
jgi:hypothetical protein